MCQRVSVRNPAELAPTAVALGPYANRLEGVLWTEYEGLLADLASDAEAIRQAVIGTDEAAVVRLPLIKPYAGEEGGVIIRLHERYERDPTQVRGKRKAAAGSLLARYAADILNQRTATYVPVISGSSHQLFRALTLAIQTKT